MKKPKSGPSKKPESEFYLKKEMKQSQLLFLSHIGSVLCLILILGALGLTTIQSRAADAANHDRFVLTECATYFMNASSYLTGEVRAYAATGDKVHYDNYMNELNTAKTREKSIEQMEVSGITDLERKQIEEMMSLSNGLVPIEQEALDDAAAGRYDDAVRAVLSVEYINTVSRIQEQKLEFLTSLSARTTAQVQRGVAATRVLESVTACLIVAVAVLQLFAYGITKKRVVAPIQAVEREMRNLAEGRLSEDFPCQPNTSETGMMIESIFIMRRNLKRYVGDISEKLTRMAEKDMTVSIDIEYVGDFEPIKTSMNRIIASMNEALGQVVSAAVEVAVEAEQVFSSAQTLASGTTEQAATLVDVATTMSRISEQVEQSSGQARMATELANAAGLQLNQSNEQLQGMLNAMREISDASGEIGKIIKTIEDIAFQTDILALNAAVEAARAGTAGKGFAVVADEVRSLANKSAEASKSTSAMIENSLRTIQSGAEIAQSASETFVEVMVNAGKAAEAMGSITVATERQFAEFAELARSMEQIAGVVQSHASVSEESATISEELNAQADSLNEVVKQFHLKKDSDRRHVWEQK